MCSLRVSWWVFEGFELYICLGGLSEAHDCGKLVDAKGGAIRPAWNCAIRPNCYDQMRNGQIVAPILIRPYDVDPVDWAYGL